MTVVECVSRKVKYSLFHAHRPLDLLRQYSLKHSGRMQPLPDWIQGNNGAVVAVQGGQEKVLKTVRILRKWGVKIAAVWIQDWVGIRYQPIGFSFPLPHLPSIMLPQSVNITVKMQSTSPQKRLWWNWEPDLLAYPDWSNFVLRLREEFDIRVMNYINPFLADVESGAKAPKSWKNNYFAEASARGFLVQRWRNSKAPAAFDSALSSANLNGSLNFQDSTAENLEDYVVTSGPGVFAGMIDLTNPEAFEWYKSLIQTNMLASGVSGWMVRALLFDSKLFIQVCFRFLSHRLHLSLLLLWRRFIARVFLSFFCRDCGCKICLGCGYKMT